MSIWGGLGHIAAPAATDRMALESALNAGGYSERGEFLWSNGGTFEGFRATDGDVLKIGKTGGASFNLFVSGDTIGGFNVPGAGAGRDGWRIIDGGVLFDINAAEVGRFSANGLGVGVNPSVRMHAKSSAEIMRLETPTARGGGQNYSTWYDPAGRAGYFGFAGVTNNISLMNDLTGSVLFGTSGANRFEITAVGHLQPSGDNASNLGSGGFRLGTLYAVTGTINTCDEREKSWREMLGIDIAAYAPNLYEAELRAGLRAIEELGFFRWNDAIALKGADEARWHFGPRAQRVWVIFADEELCPALVQREPGGDWLPPEGSIPPAFLCFDEWGEETAPVIAWWRASDILDVDGQPVMVPCAEGEEGTEQRPTGETYVTRPAGNRFGVRIDQLHSLMIAALNAERLKQEARLQLLEEAA